MKLYRLLLAVTALCAGTLLVSGVVALAMPLLLLSLLVRGVARLLEPSYVPWNQIIEFDQDIGWKPGRNLDTHYLTLPKDGVFHTITDSDGWPGRATISESDIVVIGDSFAFGYGIDFGTSFAKADGRVRIKAIGAPGYNMVQELLIMKELAPKLAGKLLVWFICVENDLIDNLSPHTFSYRTPFVKRARSTNEWEIVTRHLRPTKWFFLHDTYKNFPYQGAYLDVLAQLCGPGELSDTAYSACEFLINQARNVCAQNGVQLVVMTIPNVNQLSARGANILMSRRAHKSTIDPAFPDNQIGDICRRLDVPFLTAQSFLDEGDYKELDPHWNKRGHQRVAKALRDAYDDHRLRRKASGAASEFGKPKLLGAASHI